MKNKQMTNEPLEVIVGQLLLKHKLTLALAESCTGGLLGHRLTDVPGSSTYLMGGIVAYSYDAKEHLLGVQHNTLYDHGAVSPETALEMARGARRVFGTDIAVSVTGIAGPGGGMPGKPVGLVYICLSARDFERVEKFVWDRDRAGNKWASSEAALQMIQNYLANVDEK
jgi:PncC family amidohydrolase